MGYELNLRDVRENVVKYFVEWGLRAAGGRLKIVGSEGEGKEKEKKKKKNTWIKYNIFKK